MTAAALTPQIEYLEDGVTLNFAAPFRYLDPTDLTVSRIEDGNETELAYGTAWSASIGDTDAGGTVTLIATTSGATLQIRRATDRNQNTDYQTGDRFPAESHERALDKAMLINQEQDVSIDDIYARSVLSEPGGTGLSMDTTGLIEGDILQFTNNRLRRLNRAPFAGMFFAGDATGRMVPASGTGADAALRQDLATDAGGRGTGLIAAPGGGTVTQATVTITPEQFGAIGDDTTNSRAGFLTAQSQSVTGGRAISLGQGRTYYIGTTLTSLNNVTVMPQPGATIRGYWDRKASYKLTASIFTHLQDGTYDYLPNLESHKHGRALAEKEVFLDGIEPDRTKHVALDCTTITVYQAAWPAGDTWTTITGEAADARSLILTLNPGNWRAGMIAAVGGDELSCKQAPGAYQHAAFIRTTNGYYVFYTNDQASAGQLWYKAIGSAAVKVSDIDWTGRSDHTYWQPGNAGWTIRLYDLRTFSIMLNGVEIFGPYTIAAGVISFYGFGGQVNPAVTQGFYDWVITRGTEAGGKGIGRIVTAGDSRTAPYHGDWPTYCREILEHSCGYTVLTMANIAVDGWTSATTLATVQAYDFTGVTDFVVGVGTNDVQSSVDINTTIANIQAILDFVQAKNIRTTFILPQDFYPKALTNNTGVVVFNEIYQPMYRQAIYRVAASRGCQVVDLTKTLKAVYAYEAKAPGAAPWFANSYLTGLRDNIHNTELQYRKIGWAVARAILGWWPRKRQGFDLMEMPAAIFSNSWTPPAGSEAALWQLSESGVMTLAGRVTMGTKTDLTIIAQLPFNLSTRGMRVFPAYGNNGTLGRVIIQGTDIKIAGFSAAADTTLSLDGIVFPIR